MMKKNYLPRTKAQWISLITLKLLVKLVFVLAFSLQAQDKFGGATLYTVRDLMGQDAKATLKAVADIGYKYIEATDYKDGLFYGMKPAEFKAYLNSLGMEPISVHQGGVTLENADQLIADSKAAGFQYFVIPVPPMGHFKFNVKERSMGMSDEVVFINDVLNTIGEKCAAQGLKLLYHNHDFEFKPNGQGVVAMDYFLENTNPAWVNFQMDLFWVTTAGVDPVNYINKYPGRFKMWHVKDRDEQGRFAPVGLGTIDFARILSYAETSGLEYYIVEQDMVFDGMQPLEAIKTSHDNLSKFGFH